MIYGGVRYGLHGRWKIILDWRFKCYLFERTVVASVLPLFKSDPLEV